MLYALYCVVGVYSMHIDYCTVKSENPVQYFRFLTTRIWPLFAIQIPRSTSLARILDLDPDAGSGFNSTRNVYMYDKLEIVDI